MPLTEASITDQAQRRLSDRGMAIVDDLYSFLGSAMGRVARAAISAFHRKEVEVAVALTLPAVADGFQSVAITTVYPESIMSVHHTGMSLPLVHCGDTGDLRSRIKSTSELAGYCVQDGKIFTRSAAGLATTAGALTVRGVKIPTALSDFPAAMEPLIVDAVVELAMEALGMARPVTVDEITSGASQ
jgi:hypothetical protein